MTRGECLTLLDRDAGGLPLSLQVELLGLNRSGLYYRPMAPTAEELALKRRIDEIYNKCPFYGSRKIAAQLQRDGQQVNRKAVQRHMREMGIEGVRPGPNLSKRNLESQIYPYLLRNLAIITPNQVWGTDITCIRLANGWLGAGGSVEFVALSIILLAKECVFRPKRWIRSCPVVEP